MAEEEYGKILFKFYSTVLEEETVETMWAVISTRKKVVINWTIFPFMLPM